MDCLNENKMLDVLQAGRGNVCGFKQLPIYI
jgi:hypothetical protein